MSGRRVRLRSRTRAADEHQVVVLEEDGAARRVADRFGVELVDASVAVPRLGEEAVERRGVRDVEQVVEEEPQHLVRHDVVVQVVEVLRDVEETQREAVLLRAGRTLARELAVGIAERRRDPRPTGAFDDRRDRADQPAAAAVRDRCVRPSPRR